jgi:two-component system response regulator ResD
VSAFKMGAEDFVRQPLRLDSFRARVEARLLRSPRSMDDSMCLQYGNLMIELETQKAYTLDNGRKTEISLTGREFKILYLLARKENHVLSRAELIKAIWGTGVHVLDRTVDTHVYTLRKKLGNFSIYIQSEVGVGYRFSTGEKNRKGVSESVKGKTRERMVA